MDHHRQQQSASSSLMSSHRPQHLENGNDSSKQRRPLVLAASSAIMSSPTPTASQQQQQQQLRKLRFAQQPTTPAAPLHNLRDWMHLPTTDVKSSSGDDRRRRRYDTRQPQPAYNNHQYFSGGPSPPMVSSLLSQRDSMTPPSSSSSSTTAASLSTTPPACKLAQQAPAAGFLLKVSSSSNQHHQHAYDAPPQLKRRYFVLQPGTFLYYFLSDQDTAPRGCLDLEGSWLQEEPSQQHDRNGNAGTENGVFCFSVNWNSKNNNTRISTSNNNNNTPTNKVILQARNETEGRAWMEALETMRLDYAQALLQKQAGRNSALTSRVRELEQQVRDLKLVEEEKDLATQEALAWQQQMEALDENVRRLSLILLRQSASGEALVGKEVDTTDLHVDPDRVAVASAMTTNAADSSRDASLLDEAMDNDDDAVLSIDAMNVPGQHFQSLYNACEMLRDNVRLAAKEATTAVEDLTTANERVEEVEKRMLKAEKHLCKLWEENCALRKEVKQKKQEKRVLVKEVLSLRTAAASGATAMASVMTPLALKGDEVDVPKEATDAAGISEEEKLINELENHVMSSIRLHEQMLMSGSAKTRPQRAQENDDVNSEKTEMMPVFGLDAVIDRTSMDYADTREGLPVAALFDDADDSPSESEEDTYQSRKIESLAASISSTAVETSDGEDDYAQRHRKPLEEVDISTSSHASTPERLNPLNQLDVDTPEKGDADSLHAKSIFTQHQATSRLSCPLADVIGTRNSFDDVVSKSCGTNELQVYHLTFYSRKIGLQFQKIPPPAAKSNGLLTDALKADMTGVGSGSNRTAAELRRIAAISKYSKKAKDKTGDTCPLAQPVDAVIVCGFEGFDDSGSNIRPKLGARLVAFDGVSVEVGKWTFDSIRKAIQARERPMTLSFRNDFLTTEQRSILTRAVKEVDAKAGKKPKPKTVPMHTAPAHRLGPSLDRSVQSCITYESDPLPLNHNIHHADDDWSVSVGGSDHHYNRSYTPSSGLPQSFSAGRSFASSVGPRSFSEAGSSVSILSAVGPLVSNLLSRSQKPKEPFSPDFLRRPPTSVENTPQHADFCSELL